MDCFLFMIFLLFSWMLMTVMDAFITELFPFSKHYSVLETDEVHLHMHCCCNGQYSKYYKTEEGEAKEMCKIAHFMILCDFF